MAEDRVISHDDYLKLLGLMTLAREHTAMLDQLQMAMEVLAGEEVDSAGWVSDALYGHGYASAADAVTAILKGDKITVAPAPEVE